MTRRFIFYTMVATVLLMLAVSCGHRDGRNAEPSTPFDKQGATHALFSVSDTTQVHFSRGNLQYQASTDTWRFAEEQWIFYGYGNEKISPDAEEWIDLFGYATSGWQSGHANSPTSTSIYVTEYSSSRHEAADSLTGPLAQADWGVHNAISNGGNKPGLWRTLTID